MIYQRLGFQPPASLVQQTLLQCFKWRLTNYHHNPVSMPHLHQLVPDQRCEDQEIQSFLTSIICCQPSRCDAMSWADINTSEWWGKRAHTLEEMLEARLLCETLIFPEPVTTSFLCQITPALLQGSLGREGWSISLCQPHSSWPHTIQLCWMVFSVPSSCNLPFLRHQLCFCANPILPDVWGRRAEGIR